MDSDQVEVRVLGSVLLSNSVWIQASVLREQDFSLSAHQFIFRRMRDLAESNSPIDEFTLVDELDRHNELAFVGGRAYITSLTDGVAERKNISHLVTILQERATRRAGAKFGSELQKLATDGSVSTIAMSELASNFAAEALPKAMRYLRDSRKNRSRCAFHADMKASFAMSMDGAGGCAGMGCAGAKTIPWPFSIAAAPSAGERVPNAAMAKGRIGVKLASAQTVTAVERLARADRRHAATIEQWDADPWLLKTPIGNIDLRTGEMLSRQQGQYLAKITATGPGQDCPLFRCFLHRITDGNSELLEFLQRVIGYCLTGSVCEHALFFLYGTGANGKSVFLSTIAGLLGDYAKTAPASAFTATSTEQNPTDVAGAPRRSFCDGN